jgi:mannitol/fructose-specific phosphotransferase system IIA component (Ntr-type)
MASATTFMRGLQMKYHTISETLNSASIEMNLTSRTKREVSVELIHLLEKSGKVTDSDLVLKKLNEREKVSTTAIPGGLAMPHVKTNGVSGMCMAVGISRSGIECQAPDGGLTKIFVLAVSPEDEDSSYLITLVDLIDEFKSHAICQHILECCSTEEVYSILVSHEHKMFALR